MDDTRKTFDGDGGYHLLEQVEEGSRFPYKEGKGHHGPWGRGPGLRRFRYTSLQEKEGKSGVVEHFNGLVGGNCNCITIFFVKLSYWISLGFEQFISQQFLAKSLRSNHETTPLCFGFFLFNGERDKEMET